MKRNYKYDSWLAFQISTSHIFIGLMLLLLFSCREKKTNKTEISSMQSDSIYYCPMHPEIQQNHPGKCPKPECHGMPLVLKQLDGYLETALKPVSSNILSKIHIIQPEYKKLPVQVEALGYIDYDNVSKYDISSRYSGRIDKLYIKFNYQPIKKGDLVFDIYSPDLVTAQENLLYLLKTSPAENELINAAKQKLKLLQLTADQIEEIVTTKKIKTALPVFSKYDGHVHEMFDSKMTSTEMNDYETSPLLFVKEGMYVERGKILFNVVDPSKIVVMLKVKAADISKVHLGQKVIFFINSDTTMIMNGLVNFIEPVFSNASKTLMVRVNMDNKEHQRKIGSLVNATIISDSIKTLWVPSSALVDLGKSKIAWVQKGDSFKAVKVQTGVHSMGLVEITDGLIETDKIALEAHYLSDSEGFIKVDEDE